MLSIIVSNWFSKLYANIYYVLFVTHFFCFFSVDMTLFKEVCNKIEERVYLLLYPY